MEKFWKISGIDNILCVYVQLMNFNISVEIIFIITISYNCIHEKFNNAENSELDKLSGDSIVLKYQLEVSNFESLQCSGTDNVLV